jgi:hypothetical protein
MFQLEAFTTISGQSRTATSARRSLLSDAGTWEQLVDVHQDHLPCGDLSLEEKREYLNVLSDIVWDIESELAKAKAERAALMNSIQADAGHESR